MQLVEIKKLLQRFSHPFPAIKLELIIRFVYWFVKRVWEVSSGSEKVENLIKFLLSYSNPPFDIQIGLSTISCKTQLALTASKSLLSVSSYWSLKGLFSFFPLYVLLPSHYNSVKMSEIIFQFVFIGKKGSEMESILLSSFVTSFPFQCCKVNVKGWFASCARLPFSSSEINIKVVMRVGAKGKNGN